MKGKQFSDTEVTIKDTQQKKEVIKKVVGWGGSKFVPIMAINVSCNSRKR